MGEQFPLRWPLNASAWFKFSRFSRFLSIFLIFRAIKHRRGSDSSQPRHQRVYLNAESETTARTTAGFAFVFVYNRFGRDLIQQIFLPVKMPRIRKRLTALISRILRFNRLLLLLNFLIRRNYGLGCLQHFEKPPYVIRCSSQACYIFKQFLF